MSGLLSGVRIVAKEDVKKDLKREKKERKKERKEIRGMAKKSLDVANWTEKLLSGTDSRSRRCPL